MKAHLERLRRLLKGESDFMNHLESGYLTQEDYDKVADLSDPACPKCDDGLIGNKICDCVIKELTWE